ncbi:hypothetical protein SNE40_002786 [Patella caerulea]|uniref:SGNH hydrolase-type esterase domain-containing protein n=1 Tax=Patella caerulea TaxID=87958 RepID=A0AAN8K8F8_PATCE
MFHTTSSALVNGNHENIFLNTHLPEILDLVNTLRADNLNKDIRHKIHVPACTTTTNTSVKKSQSQPQTGASTPSFVKSNTSNTDTHLCLTEEEPTDNPCTSSEEQPTMSTISIPSVGLPEENPVENIMVCSSTSINVVRPSTSNTPLPDPPLHEHNPRETLPGRENITPIIPPRPVPKARRLKLTPSVSSACSTTYAAKTISSKIKTKYSKGASSKSNSPTQLTNLQLTVTNLESEILKLNAELKEKNNTITGMDAENSELKNRLAKLLEENKTFVAAFNSLTVDNNKLRQENQMYTCKSTNDTVTTSDTKDQSQQTDKSLNVEVIEPCTNFIIGSSVLKKINSRRLDRSGNTAVRAISGGKIRDATNLLERCSISRDVKRIVYLIGSNNVSHNMNLDSCKNDYRQLIETSQTKYPNAEINFLKLLPRRSTTFNQQLESLNTVLKQICSDHNCTFISDHVSYFARDNSIKDYLYTDGTHPNYKGSAKLASQLKTTLNLEIRKFGQTNMNKSPRSSFNDRGMVPPPRITQLPFWLLPPMADMRFPPPNHLPTFPFDKTYRAPVKNPAAFTYGNNITVQNPAALPYGNKYQPPLKTATWGKAYLRA